MKKAIRRPFSNPQWMEESGHARAGGFLNASRCHSLESFRGACAANEIESEEGLRAADDTAADPRGLEEAEEEDKAGRRTHTHTHTHTPRGVKGPTRVQGPTRVRVYIYI